MFSRRRFIRIGAASVGSLALRNFGLLPALAQSVSDYKALVCIFLFGGNDSNNMIIPADPATFAEYTKIRASLALSNSSSAGQLVEVAAKSGSSYYFHSGLKELSTLFTNGNLAVAANVGPLVQPITSKTQLGNPAEIPSHLFSHSDQQAEWQTSDPTELDNPPFGWGGRTADQVALKKMNGASTFPTFFSVAGSDIFGGGKYPQVALSPGGSLNLANYDYGNPTFPISQAFTNLLTTDTGLSLAGAADGIMLNALSDAEQLAKALKGITVTSTFPATGLGAQLKQVAQIIKARDGLGMQRQIFFCSLGGFDTHEGEMETLNTLYPQLSQAVSAFYTALTTELTLQDNVTVFTESDFSRTFMPSTTDGSDHAWGSHHMVVGGAVKGQTIYNSFPTFELGGPSDYDSGSGARGRWVPTAAVDQYGAELVKWFASTPSGAAVFDPAAVFPNLAAHFNGVTNPFTFLG